MIAHVQRLASIALRNVTRQRRRSLAVIVALSLAVATLVMTRGVINGVQTLLKRRVVLGQVGALSVRPRGSSSLQSLFSPEQVLAVARALPGSIGASARLSFPIVAGFGDRSIVVWGVAIDPENDPRVCPAAIEELGDGAPVSGDSAVTTPGIARALGAGIGDELVLLANDRDGVLNAATVRLSGLSKGPPKQSAEDRVLFLPLSIALPLARSEGQVGEVIVGSEDPDGAPALAAALRARIPAELEVRTWQDIAPFIVDLISNQERVLGTVSAMFAFVAALGISHALVLSVMGRRRELGIMLALGVRRSSLLLLVVLETCLLSVVAGVAGAMLGGACVWIAHAIGVPITLPGGDTPDLVRPHVAALDLVRLALAGMAVATLAAFVPARRASRATPQGVLVGR